MTLFKYFKKVQHTVLESAQASGPKEVEENLFQKQLQSTKEPQPKEKRQRYSTHDKIQQPEITKWGIAHGIRPAARKCGVPESKVQRVIKNYREDKVENE